MAHVEYENIVEAAPLVKEELSLLKTDNVGRIKKQLFPWYQIRNARKKAFAGLADDITEVVINRKEILFVINLNRFAKN